MRVKIKGGTAVRLKKSRRPLSTARDCTADLDKLGYTKEEQEELLQHPGITPAYDATDGAMKLAAELEIDLTDITGTGADGRIVVDDVRAAAKSDKGS